MQLEQVAFSVDDHDVAIEFFGGLAASTCSWMCPEIAGICWTQPPADRLAAAREGENPSAHGDGRTLRR